MRARDRHITGKRGATRAKELGCTSITASRLGTYWTQYRAGVSAPPQKASGY
jgi:hypothetical protein